MDELLSRKSYRAVVRMLAKLKAEHELDRQENPELIPLGWGMVIPHHIEEIIRGNHERCPRDLPGKVMEYLVKKGLLVHYHGDYAFPGPLPTREEIEEQVNVCIRMLNQHK